MSGSLNSSGRCADTAHPDFSPRRIAIGALAVALGVRNTARGAGCSVRREAAAIRIPSQSSRKRSGWTDLAGAWEPWLATHASADPSRISKQEAKPPPFVRRRRHGLAALTVRVVVGLGGDVRPVRLVLGLAAGWLSECPSTGWSDWQRLSRPPPPEDLRRDLIGAWQPPRRESCPPEIRFVCSDQTKGRCR